jgi:hypothetical protein
MTKRFGFTWIALWRIEVARFSDRSDADAPHKPIITIPLLYRDMGMVMMLKTGVTSLRKGSVPLHPENLRKGPS